MSYTNLNNIVNMVADEQGIEVGSVEWNEGGIAAFSGQTGVHSSYGWNHDHRLDPDWIRAVIANYGHRRVFYANAPKRQNVGYNSCGRPVGWSPELPGDLSDGSVGYFTSKGIVIVTGPDIQHCWLNPLFSLIDDPNPIDIRVLGKTMKSNSVAKIIAELHVQALVGQHRKSPWYIASERGATRIIDTTIQAARRKAISGEDALFMQDYLDTTMLEFYEKGPGLHYSNRPRFPDRDEEVVYNGLHWQIPVWYDWWMSSPEGKNKDRVHAVLTRMCQWSADLQEAVDAEQAYMMSGFSVPKGALEGEKPQPSIAGLLEKEHIYFGSIDWSEWSFRACQVAAKILPGNKTLQRAKKHLEDKWKDGDKRWVVDADGKPIA